MQFTPLFLLFVVQRIDGSLLLRTINEHFFLLYTEILRQQTTSNGFASATDRERLTFYRFFRCDQQITSADVNF